LTRFHEAPSGDFDSHTSSDRLNDLSTELIAGTLLLALLLMSACGKSPSGSEPTVEPNQGGAEQAPAATDKALIPTPETTAIPAAGREVEPDLLLPDLKTTEPAELFIEYAGGRRYIRASTTVENVGIGPLRIAGALSAAGTTATATQIAMRQRVAAINIMIGRMRHDPAHGHWHLNNFAMLELWTYEPGGELETMLRNTPKITFCLLDIVKIRPETPVAAAAPEFSSCDWQSQGISQG